MFSAIAANKMFEPELTRKLEPRLGFCSGRCACSGNDQAIGEFLQTIVFNYHYFQIVALFFDSLLHRFLAKRFALLSKVQHAFGILQSVIVKL